LFLYRPDGIVSLMAAENSLPERSEAQTRLLDAAESVVAREGVGNLTLEAVAREAGVSKGGLLYHYPSKSALVTAVVERLAQRCECDQCKVMAEEGQRPGAFTRAFLATRNRLLGPAEQPLHTALLAAAGTDPQYLEPIRAKAREWQARLENDGIDPAIATIVRLAIDGLCIGNLLGLPMPDGELRDRVIEKLRDMTNKE
jgi:AcrR family transcriptional regulator